MARADAREETLAIPANVRSAVHERDGHHCRFCGRYDENIALHHVIYGGDARGMGGRRVHDPMEIISVGWVYGHNCHETIHSNKRLYQPLALEVVRRPGVTMLQLLRWQQAAERKARRA